LPNESDISRLSGLSDAQSAERLGAEGRNEPPASKPRKLFVTVLGVMRAPMFLFLLLLVSGGLYLLLGDVRAAMLPFFVFVVRGIALYQERRTGRVPGAPLSARRLLAPSQLQGAGVLLVMLAIFGRTLYRGLAESEARSLTFTALVVANLALVFIIRSWTRGLRQTLRLPNPALWRVTGAALLLLAVVLYVPAIRELFRFAPLHAPDLIFCVIAGVVSVPWFEPFKRFGRTLKTEG
jgi:magnesium-transporting ATPase (P-type)